MLDMNTFCCSIDHNPFFRESRTTPMKSFFIGCISLHRMLFSCCLLRFLRTKCSTKNALISHTQKGGAASAQSIQCNNYVWCDALMWHDAPSECIIIHRSTSVLSIVWYSRRWSGVPSITDCFPSSLSVSCSSPWFPPDHLNLKPLVLVQPPI